MRLERLADHHDLSTFNCGVKALNGWLPLDLEFAGMGNSGDPTLAARDEEILAAELNSNED